MPARRIDGNKIAEDVRFSLKKEVQSLTTSGCVPGLAVVLVGEDSASKIYVNMKTKRCAELGINSRTIPLPVDTSRTKLLTVIDELNKDDSVHGILVQLPLPRQIDEQQILNAISPAKDVDGFHPVNRGKLAAGADGFVPCTPLGIQEMLLRSDVNPAGKHVVIVGRSNLVGLPMALILVQKKEGANATVTVCHSRTEDLPGLTKQADILIAAMGRPEVITADMVKEGAVVIDVGVNRVEDLTAEKGYRIVGDVDFGPVSEKAAAISPVPGGVGPMTIAMLIHNTVKAAKQSCASSSIG